MGASPSRRMLASWSAMTTVRRTKTPVGVGPLTPLPAASTPPRPPARRRTRSLRVLVTALWRPENHASGPNTKHVAQREQGKYDCQHSHYPGLLPAPLKVALRRHCANALSLEGMEAL